jgi:hypothetical protein
MKLTPSSTRTLAVLPSRGDAALMRFLLVAALLLVPMVAHAAEADDRRKLAAAQAAGCSINRDYPFGVDLQRLAGQADPSVTAVGAMSGEADADTLGSLCVGLVQEKGGRFGRLAVSPALHPPGEIAQVTNVYVNVSRTPFRFNPSETAFGVEVDGEYNSVVTNTSWGTLYLFRRVGARLQPIFDAKVRDETIDKTDPKGGEAGQRWIVRFDTAMHGGAYDIILQRYHGKQQRRFRWNGTHYVPG